MAAVIGVEAAEVAASALAESGLASAAESGLASAAESGLASAVENKALNSAEKAVENKALKSAEKAVENKALKSAEKAVENKALKSAENVAETKVVNAAEKSVVEKSKKKAETPIVSEESKHKRKTSNNKVKTKKRENNTKKNNKDKFPFNISKIVNNTKKNNKANNTKKNNKANYLVSNKRKNNSRNLVVTYHNCDTILGIPRTKESKKLAKEIKRNYRTLKNGMKLYYNKKATCLDENIIAQENELMYLKTTKDKIPKYARRKRATSTLRRNIRELENICTEKLNTLCRLTPDLLKTIKSKNKLKKKDKEALELFNLLSESIQICGERRYCMNNRIKLRNIYSDALRVLSTMQNQFLGSYF
jgi:outer membrane biosynthesis protein TonB